MRCQALGAAILLVTANAAAAESPHVLVDRAVVVVEEMRHDPGVDAADLLRRARAVMVVPELSKGGLLVGGQGGTGLLLVKNQGGGWSNPVFYSIGGATIGLQVGFQTAKLVFCVMSEAALQTWLRGDFKFGGQDGMAVFMHGTEVSFNVNENRAYYGRIVGAQEIISGGVINPSADPLRNALALR
jgi:lipid-binding SYLF domain-containing protein